MYNWIVRFLYIVFWHSTLWNFVFFHLFFCTNVFILVNLRPYGEKKRKVKKDSCQARPKRINLTVSFSQKLFVAITYQHLLTMKDYWRFFLEIWNTKFIEGNIVFLVLYFYTFFCGVSWVISISFSDHVSTDSYKYKNAMKSCFF